MLLHKSESVCTSQALSCPTGKFLEHDSSDAQKCPYLKGSMQTGDRGQGEPEVDEGTDETEN